MRIAKASAIAAFVLSIAAGSALAADASGPAQSDTNAAAPKTGVIGTLGIDMSQAGTDAPSMHKYFSGLTPTQQAELQNKCNGPVTMTDQEKMFCNSIK